MERQKTSKGQQYWGGGGRKKLEESGSLTSDYTIGLHQSRQYGTGTEKEI